MMSSENEHTKPEEQLEDATEKLLRSARPSFRKSKEQIWVELQSKLPASEKNEPVIRTLNWWKLSVAASVILLIGTGLFARFHAINASSTHGEQFSVVLPDGSEVMLNAASELSYHPYWWWANREVKFEGEGFFNVEKGSDFNVISANGTTTVLGTSFNIKSRWEDYIVYCKTGLVRVSNARGSVVLKPNELAVSMVNTAPAKSVFEDELQFTGWMENKFTFTASPMRLVLRELELQYGIQIKITDKSIGRMTYSGYFDSVADADTVLNIIEQSMRLRFVKTGENKYSVSYAN
jgi:transmembrane sensor